MLAWLAAARGREAECRNHLGRALELGGPGVNVGVYTTRILGLLELALGNPGEALKHLERLDFALDREGVGEPSLFMATPDLIEARVQSGQRTEAMERLVAFEKQAERTRRTWALAAAARCRGLLEPDFDRAFEAALGWHEQTPTPFERARTELCFGERLRRSKRRSEARERLNSALDVFEQLDADAWVKRTLSELRAAGDSSADDAGVASRPQGRGRSHQPRGGGGALPEPQNSGVAPESCVQQARSEIPDRAGATFCAGRGAPRGSRIRLGSGLYLQTVEPHTLHRYSDLPCAFSRPVACQTRLVLVKTRHTHGLDLTGFSRRSWFICTA